MALSPIQNNFIWLFCTQGDFDVVESARQMGVPVSEAMRWFLDVDFQKALGQAQRLRFQLLGVNPYRTLAELAALAYSNITDIVRIDESGRYCVRSFDEIPERALAAVQSIKLRRTSTGNREEPVFEDVIEIKMHDKRGALATLAELQQVGSVADIQHTAATEGPRRVAGLLVTPPRPKDELA